MLRRMYGVACDGCAALIGGHRDAKSARRAAIKAGWTRIKGDMFSGKDYCPRCAEQKSREAARLVERG